MKETNDKIVQEYIERASHIILPYVGYKYIDRDETPFIVEIAKMIQLEDLHSRDKMSFLDYQGSLAPKVQKYTNATGPQNGYPEQVYPPQASLKSPEQKQLEQQGNQN